MIDDSQGDAMETPPATLQTVEDKTEIKQEPLDDSEAMMQQQQQDVKAGILEKTEPTAIKPSHLGLFEAVASQSKPDAKDVVMKEATTKMKEKTSTSETKPKAIRPDTRADAKTESRPKIYLKDEFQLKSKEAIMNECKNKSSDCLKCAPVKIKCIHCNYIMDVNMDCILYHCKSCETIVRRDDDEDSNDKYLCFACKVYVFDNTGGRTHIKKHISTHLKRMKLYEPGNTWY
ncbi:uncharacterized protein LOC103524372 [Diaphorina citri]|uniref:Uncharacterized protein LOC103524372 n=1 Tax=Diaphorina citri TaxID=121845 RepID=A0A3Q0JLN6_DIACI|nr:uncharacterized protein LOC103524372 [Diaphorina citri]